jgi:hypothetical protein
MRDLRQVQDRSWERRGRVAKPLGRGDPGGDRSGYSLFGILGSRTAPGATGHGESETNPAAIADIEQALDPNLRCVHAGAHTPRSVADAMPPGRSIPLDSLTAFVTGWPFAADLSRAPQRIETNQNP